MNNQNVYVNQADNYLRLILSVDMRATKAISPFHVHFTTEFDVFGKFEFTKEIDCTGERAATPNGDSKKGSQFIFGGAGKIESFSPRGVRENIRQYAAIQGLSKKLLHLLSQRAREKTHKEEKNRQ